MVRFDNLEMTLPKLYEDNPDIPKITITHAEVTYNNVGRNLLKLHFYKEYGNDHAKEELRSSKTSHFIWLDKNMESY